MAHGYLGYAVLKLQAFCKIPAKYNKFSLLCFILFNPFTYHLCEQYCPIEIDVYNVQHISNLKCSSSHILRSKRNTGKIKFSVFNPVYHSLSMFSKFYIIHKILEYNLKIHLTSLSLSFPSVKVGVELGEL